MTRIDTALCLISNTYKDNMAQNCDAKLAVNIVYDACNPAAKGLKPIGYIANFEDVNQSAMTMVEGKNLYKDFVLNSGAKLYKIYQAGKTPFNGATSEAQVGTYRVTWNKTLPFIILNNGAEVTKNIIDKLANGRFVAIVENAFAGNNGDNAFEIIGLETGLTLTEGNNEKWNEDYGGGWSLTLVEENAPTSGIYVLADASEGTAAADATRELLESKVLSA